MATCAVPLELLNSMGFVFATGSSGDWILAIINFLGEPLFEFSLDISMPLFASPNFLTVTCDDVVCSELAEPCLSDTIISGVTFKAAVFFDLALFGGGAAMIGVNVGGWAFSESGLLGTAVIGDKVGGEGSEDADSPCKNKTDWVTTQRNNLLVEKENKNSWKKMVTIKRFNFFTVSYSASMLVGRL